MNAKEDVNFPEVITVTNPLGQSTMVDKVIKNCSLMYGERTFLLLIKGTNAYLVYIIDSSKSRNNINQVPIMKEFPDLFPGELPSMPPNREMEF
ncbi:DNA/RNA polymerases superfamily protein [Gossypium australe]|uniref:DNA/RNA polymerases superfamily protein n=1 Tax=Gossypium australe TaxID=47621 RepID=A0A5B6VAS1_9ROSI|nr:DNA/RNA polymerases superfamily protein [Gossypium australe]